MPYRAEKLEDLDWTFIKEGELQRETLQKQILTEGAWPVIAYLYRNLKDGIPEDRHQICLIRYGRRKSKIRVAEGEPEPPKQLVPHHRLNLPTKSLAWRIAAQILRWFPVDLKAHGADVSPDKVVEALDSAILEEERRAKYEAGRKRSAGWARRRERLAREAAEAEAKKQGATDGKE